MSLRHFLALLGGLNIVALAGCGSGDTKCFEDSTCPQGNRCVLTAVPGAAGACKPCDVREVPYDGIDNDCNARTKDDDVDSDGDNSKTSAVDPGGDCDDADPAVSSKQAEICGDMKDNNCDGRVDERECADRTHPTVSVLTPTEGSTVSGMVAMSASAMDDVGMERVDFLSGAGAVLASKSSPPFEALIDSTLLPDGPTDLVARGYDLLGKSGEARVRVFVENRTGPRITAVRPVRGGAYGGRMTIDLSARDPQGIASLRLSLDSTEVTTSTSAALVYPLDTRRMFEGLHVLVIDALDKAGSRSQTTITFLVDNQAPGARLTGGPANGNVTGTVPLTVTASDASSLNIGILGQTFNASPAVYSFDSRNYFNGSMVVTATVTDSAIVDDGAGLPHTRYVSLTLNLNNTGHTRPTNLFTAPLDGDDVYLDTVVAARAVLPGENLNRLEFYADGELIGFSCAPPGSPGYQQGSSGLGCSLHWDFRSYSGPVRLRSVAYWRGGISATDEITVNAIPPVRFEGAHQVLLANIVQIYGAADTNADGYVDIWTCAGIQSLAYRGRGALGLLPLADPTDRCVGLVSGDFDGNGVGDYVSIEPPSALVLNGGMPVPLGGTVFASGDINGDGRTDVLAYDSSGGSAYLGSPTGLGPLQASGLPMSGDGLLLDVDLDGDLDVLFPEQSNTNDWAVSVFLNDGSGNFAPSGGTSISVPSSGWFAQSFAIVDFDHDGLADLALGSIDGLLIYPGVVGTPGRFGPAAAVPGFAQTSHVTGGDMDEDGHPDLIVLEEGIISVITFAGTRAAFVPPRATALVVADLDGDHHLDLVTHGNEFSVIRGNGDGTLRLPRITGPVPVAITAVDLAGDGKPEVAAVTAGASLEIFSASGGAFRHDSSQQLTALPDAVQIAAGPLGGTGKADLAVAASTPDVDILRFDAAGNFTETSHRLAGVRNHMIIADVDSDGASEVVIPAARGLNVLPQNGTPSVVAPMLTIGSNVEVADFDGDGVNEIATQSGAQLSLTRPNPLMSRQFASVLGHIAVGRIGRDALPDVFVPIANAFGTHLGDAARGLAPLQRVSLPFGPVVPHSNLIADLNGDGLGDLLLLPQIVLPFGGRTDGAREVLIMLGNPRGGFRPPVSYPLRIPDAANQALAAGDFDGDGKLDLAVLTTRGVALLRNARP